MWLDFFRLSFWLDAAIPRLYVSGGSSTTTVTNTPPPRTPEEIEADRLRLLELQRQNNLAESLLPGQQHLIELQNRLLQYQLDHSGDLDALHNQQLELTRVQIQNAINEEAMRQQLQPQQLQFLQNQNQLAIEQISSLRETTSAQREQNQYILESMRDQSRRLAARNAAYSPEEEARAAAEEARRASRMGAMSEEAANIQLENLKRGNKPTPEQLANINEAINAAQGAGESDISKFLRDTQRQINEETAQAAGLRPTDTPVVRLSERAGEEAARQQGQLTRKMAETRATAMLNYPLAANQLEGTQAATLQNLTSGAANFQDQLRLAAAANRTQAFQLPSSLGFATPQPTPSANLSFMNSPAPGYNPGAFNMQFRNYNPSTQTTTQQYPWWAGLQGAGQAASGVGSLISAGATLFSDVRLKTDIERVGFTDAGLPVYRYRYKGDATPHMGVMAQQVERLFPEAVHTHASGYKMVDYSRVH